MTKPTVGKRKMANCPNGAQRMKPRFVYCDGWRMYWKYLQPGPGVACLFLAGAATLQEAIAEGIWHLLYENGFRRGTTAVVGRVGSGGTPPMLSTKKSTFPSAKTPHQPL
jgi:hypothetical protein